ncbi:hypothetical protein JHK82_023924 [Glycine max]|uniref:Uncharacterized protein n=1 Tax=Glycine soja TaxID=3848 RepID=A0A0B2PZA6_GLYSO|nr:hypothetical protein JHK87_023878 [Glycine soja]KAG5132736.1 hypothetical protein JHK82_023924 [Glycine max]KHN12882.1 hypothetical protein glysoja_029416 [Glycine soja]RZB90470.1 hypothetical protein D0Y65_023089 [Glycine soja]
MADMMQRTLELVQADQAAKGSNYGTSNSFNQHGNGNQNFSGATINSGNDAGNRNRYHTSNHYNEHVLNNTGVFNGNGNGGHIEGGFHSSKRIYYRRR